MTAAPAFQPTDSSAAEAVTALTDGAVACLALQLGADLARRGSKPYAAAFALAALAAGAGAVAHGFKAAGRQSGAAWAASKAFATASGGAALVAALRYRAPVSLYGPLSAAVAAKTVAAALVAARGSFRAALGSYAIDLLGVAGLHSGDAPGRAAFRQGVALTIAAAAAQRLQWRRGRPLNHNDVFHALQACALVRLHAGARRYPPS